MLRRLATFCYTHRWRVLIAWIVVLIGVNVLAQTVGGDLLKTFNVPGTESQRAFDTLARDFSRKGDTGDFVWKAQQGNWDSPEVRAAVQPVIDQLRKSPHVVSVSSPLDANPANRRFVSQDKKIAYAEILFDVQSNDVPVSLSSHLRDVVANAEKANGGTVQVELGGYMF